MDSRASKSIVMAGVAMAKMVEAKKVRAFNILLPYVFVTESLLRHTRRSPVDLK
tara:strand:+ start:2805 stop:2966 length:162 start_codon:yes stop_codon:yes gene_type:complete